MLSYVPCDRNVLLANNDIFELLLRAEKKKHLKYFEYTSDVCTETAFFYALLSYAQEINNKSAFQSLVTIDPYNVVNSNRLKTLYSNYNSKTLLDVMIESGNFDPENIAYFKEHGGKTTRELMVKKEEQSSLGCIIS